MLAKKGPPSSACSHGGETCILNTEGHGIDKFLVDDKQTSQAIATKEEGMLILEIQHGILYFSKCNLFSLR
jgi:hypothetical protein